MNDLAPAPTIVHADATAEVRYPRTGDAQVTITTGAGAPLVAVRGGASVRVDSDAALTASRSQVLSDARRVLPARK